ncbi:MAG: coenzyme F420-0:L-glutamate ligase [Anaerolineales bacterium]
MTTLRHLELTALPSIPLIRAGDDLAQIILDGLERCDIRVRDGDVIVVAQKVVSKAEGQLVDLRTVTPSPAAGKLAAVTNKDPRLVELILAESTKVVRAVENVLIVAHNRGYISAAAGIDRSNLEPGDGHEYVLLLPRDAARSCADLRARLQAATGARLGVIINDSHNRPWRSGAVGVALAVAGTPAVANMRGKPDLFNRMLKSTLVGVADELASAASILMGQSDEGCPVVHVRGVPYPLSEGRSEDLIRPKEEDLFR